jgi:molybdopterin-guanine dinucleotide biosynthesis protein A
MEGPILFGMILTKLKFSGYVLAGGKSSRMGTDKALLALDGETFLERALKALEAACENRVKIVLNRRQTHFIEQLPPAVPRLFDIYENLGALGGIHAALRDCATAYAVILACDMPLIGAGTIEKLTRAALASHESAAVIPIQADGRPQPLSAVYRVEKCLPELERYLSTESSAAVRDFLKTIDARFIEANSLGGGEDPLFNVNRPPDYRSLNKKTEN